MNKLEQIGQQARAASVVLKNAPTAQKNEALRLAAIGLRENVGKIKAVNKQDCDAAVRDLTPAQLDRLRLDDTRIEAMARGLKTIATLPDPVGSTIAQWQTPNGLDFTRMRVPLGVIGVIFESRPNVTADAAALCLKSGNACILRPGSECFASAGLIAGLFSAAIKQAGLPAAAVQLVPSADRELVGELLRLDEHIDVLIPRGGKSLIARVKAESRIPVLAHLDGNCHVYVDGKADLEMATRVVLNAKMRRTGICGAAETLLIDKTCTQTHLLPLLTSLLDAGCEVRVEPETLALDHRLKRARDEDWHTEYLDAIIAVKVVDGVTEAIAHIEQYGSHHTDSIVTDDPAAAQLFLSRVDSAIVLHNASTQFADGGEFGMGAEIGIATGRLHARGPVGLEQLTTFKYVVRGNGQVRTG